MKTEDQITRHLLEQATEAPSQNFTVSVMQQILKETAVHVHYKPLFGKHQWWMAACVTALIVVVSLIASPNAIPSGTTSMFTDFMNYISQLRWPFSFSALPRSLWMSLGAVVVLLGLESLFGNRLRNA